MAYFKLIIAFFLCCGTVLANTIEILANSFYADENKGYSLLSGDVVISREKDILKAQKVNIYTDKKNRPLRYVATDEASFEIMLNGKLYKGKGDELVYIVAQDTYEINGNAFIQEESNKQQVQGDKIVINLKKGVYSVTSKDKKPTRFVFELDEK